MADRGYIHRWRINDGLGRILVCSGDFANLSVRFKGEDCDSDLMKILQEQNITEDKICPPPDNVLLVSFDLTVVSGELRARNVSLT